MKSPKKHVQSGGEQVAEQTLVVQATCLKVISAEGKAVRSRVGEEEQANAFRSSSKQTEDLSYIYIAT